MSGAIGTPPAAQVSAETAAIYANAYAPLAGQRPPPGDWATWLLLAGRGYGKTRTGAAWIVPAAATGAWAARAGEVASYTSGGWRYAVPREGCVAWLRDVQRFSVRTAAGWRDDGWPAAGVRIGTRLALTGGAPTVAGATGGTVVDAEARTAIAALLTALRGQGVIA